MTGGSPQICEDSQSMDTLRPPSHAAVATAPSGRGGVGVRARWFSARGLLGALVLLFLVTPVVEDIKYGGLIETVLLSLVLVSALLAIGGRRRTLAVALVLLAPALVGKWLDRFQPGLLPPWVFLGAALVFAGFVVANLLRFVLRAPRVDAEVLCAGVSIYMMLGLLWAFAYVLVGRLSPGAFAFSAGPEAEHVMDGFNAFYFSFVTLSTVGFGDVAPVSKVARTLAVTEAVVGMFYMAILVARLVSLYSAHSSENASDQTPGERTEP
jgi:hypothetical protein